MITTYYRTILCRGRGLLQGDRRQPGNLGECPRRLPVRCPPPLLQTLSELLLIKASWVPKKQLHQQGELFSFWQHLDQVGRWLARRQRDNKQLLKLHVPQLQPKGCGWGGMISLRRVNLYALVMLQPRYEIYHSDSLCGRLLLLLRTGLVPGYLNNSFSCVDNCSCFVLVVLLTN